METTNDTLWLDIVQNISIHNLSNNGKKTVPYRDELDKTIHNKIIPDYCPSFLFDVSNHAIHIVKQYREHQSGCHLFLSIMIYLSVYLISINEFYDW